MPDADIEALVSGVGLAGCHADIVVAGDGRVKIFKDRDGDAPEVLTRLRTALGSLDQVEAIRTPTLCGVPIDRVESITLDGAHWLEPLGEMHWGAPPGDGGPVLTFRVAQSPGGKNSKAKLGIGNGEMLSVPVTAVRGVIIKER